MANSTPEPMAPDPEELRTAIASGDPVKSMPALAKLRAYLSQPMMML